MKQKLIIFDMDGTLVNSSLTIANAINYVRKNLGFDPMEQDKILRTYRIRSDRSEDLS